MVRFFAFANADEIEELPMLTAIAENIDHLRKTRLLDVTDRFLTVYKCLLEQFASGFRPSSSIAVCEFHRTICPLV